jgi:hypothetical protein
MPRHIDRALRRCAVGARGSWFANILNPREDIVDRLPVVIDDCVYYKAGAMLYHDENGLAHGQEFVDAIKKGRVALAEAHVDEKTKSVTRGRCHAVLGATDVTTDDGLRFRFTAPREELA